MKKLFLIFATIFCFGLTSCERYEPTHEIKIALYYPSGKIDTASFAVPDNYQVYHSPRHYTLSISQLGFMGGRKLYYVGDIEKYEIIK